MANNRIRRKSPIKDKPLKNPGESSEVYLYDVLAEKAQFWILLGAFPIALAAYEWIKYALKQPYTPLYTTIFALIAASIAAAKLIPMRRKIVAIKLGISGERAVARCLDELRQEGYLVIHDVDMSNFNIDHVVIGPTGIYVIETKTRSKIEGRPKQRVTFDGDRILVDGHTPDRDPIAQVSAAGRDVAKAIKDIHGVRPPIRCAVLFPVWWVEGKPTNTSVWVLNEKAFVKWVRGDDRVLSGDDVRRFARTIENMGT